MRVRSCNQFTPLETIFKEKCCVSKVPLSKFSSSSSQKLKPLLQHRFQMLNFSYLVLILFSTPGLHSILGSLLTSSSHSNALNFPPIVFQRDSFLLIPCQFWQAKAVQTLHEKVPPDFCDSFFANYFWSLRMISDQQPSFAF